MIEKIECEIMRCDGCDETYEDYFGEFMFLNVEHKAVKGAGWVKDGDKHYCRSCAKERRLIDD